MSGTRERDEAEARRKRIECRRQAGLFLESTGDMKWLYFDLMIRGAFEDWRTEDDLEKLLRETIWSSLWNGEGAIEQAAHYIDRPIFHCTALRDFLVVRLIEPLSKPVHDPVKDRLVAAARKVMLSFLLPLALVLYAFVNWWAAAAVLFFLAIKGYSWLKEIDNTQKCKFRNRCTREKINEITATVKRGGFDEPTIIRQLEIFDVKIPPVPKLIYVYGCPYFLGSDPTGIQEHTIPIPDVLYALLRLPRRNVQNEILATVSALDERKRDELTRRWRKFLDPMLTYNEPEADEHRGAARARMDSP
jgi:hypothetical protein